MKQELEKLLEKPMNRKSFLKHVGAGAMVMIGLGTIVKTLNSLNARPTSTAGNGSTTTYSSYGTSVYGGHKDYV